MNTRTEAVFGFLFRKNCQKIEVNSENKFHACSKLIGTDSDLISIVLKRNLSTAFRIFPHEKEGSE